MFDIPNWIQPLASGLVLLLQALLLVVGSNQVKTIKND